MLSHIFFSKIFDKIKKKIPEFLKDLSKNLERIPKENDIKRVDLEINSTKNEPKGLSIELFGFPQEKYNKYYPSDFQYTNDDAISASTPVVGRHIVADRKSMEIVFFIFTL